MSSGSLAIIRMALALGVLVAIVSVPVVAAVVNFPDPGLEAVIRAEVWRPTGDIYNSDLFGLASLDASSQNITNLEGIQHCVDLTWLALEDNQIADTSKLSSLTKLTVLDLSDNQIVGITALKDLTDLTWLALEDNQIADITTLSCLTKLTMLGLCDNQIVDITALKDLTNLTWLCLHGNQIADITTLENLTNLTTLCLHGNQIADISPLVNNSGLGSGDTLDLCNNYLDLTPGSPDMMDIQALQGRGVNVDYDPQNLIAPSAVEITLGHFTPDSVPVGVQSTVILSGTGFTEGMEFEVTYDGINVIDAHFLDSGQYWITIAVSEDISPGHYSLTLTATGDAKQAAAAPLHVSDKDCADAAAAWEAAKKRWEEKKTECEPLKQRVTTLEADKKAAEQDLEGKEAALKDAKDAFAAARDVANEARGKLEQLIRDAIHAPEEVSIDPDLRPEPKLTNWLVIGGVPIYFSGSDTSVQILLWFLEAYRAQWTSLQDGCSAADDEVTTKEMVRDSAGIAVTLAKAKLAANQQQLTPALQARDACVQQEKALKDEMDELAARYGACTKRLTEQTNTSIAIEAAKKKLNEATADIAAAERTIASIRKECGDPCECAKAQARLEAAEVLLGQAKKSAARADEAVERAEKEHKTGCMKNAMEYLEEAAPDIQDAQDKVVEAAIAETVEAATVAIVNWKAAQEADARREASEASEWDKLFRGHTTMLDVPLELNSDQITNGLYWYLRADMRNLLPSAAGGCDDALCQRAVFEFLRERKGVQSLMSVALAAAAGPFLAALHPEFTAGMRVFAVLRTVLTAYLAIPGSVATIMRGPVTLTVGGMEVTCEVTVGLVYNENTGIVRGFIRCECGDGTVVVLFITYRATSDGSAEKGTVQIERVS